MILLKKFNILNKKLKKDLIYKVFFNYLILKICGYFLKISREAYNLDSYS